MVQAGQQQASPWAGRGWLFIVLFGVAYAIVSRVALDGFPFSGDEYSMFLQGEIFARGLLHAATPAHAELLRVDHVILEPWVMSKYPPGTSALLALGIRAGVPWLVTPVEGVVTLGLVWVTARKELGAVAASLAVVVVGLAPLFVFQSSSFFSHTATTMWLAATLACASRWVHSKRDAWLMLGGAALGLAFLTRPLDAVLVGCALLALQSWRVVGLSALGAAPFVALNFAYQSAQFGGALHDGYHAYEPTFRAIYGDAAAANLSLGNVSSIAQQFNHLDACRSLIADWAFPGSVIVAILGARAIGRHHPARAMRDVHVLLVIVMLLTLLPMMVDPDDGARPRYLSSALLSIGFLVGPGWVVARDVLVQKVGSRLTRVMVVAALLMAPLQIGSFFLTRLPMQWRREGLYAAVAKAGVTDGLVVVRARYPTRYARNGAFFDRPVVYVSAPKDMPAATVAALLPGKPVYEAIEGDEWEILRRP